MGQLGVGDTSVTKLGSKDCIVMTNSNEIVATAARRQALTATMKSNSKG